MITVPYVTNSVVQFGSIGYQPLQTERMKSWNRTKVTNDDEAAARTRERMKKRYRFDDFVPVIDTPRRLRKK